MSDTPRTMTHADRIAALKVAERFKDITEKHGLGPSYVGDMARALIATEAELAAATARIAELERICKFAEDTASDALARMATVERDAADAERYRWLRDCAAQQSLYAVMDLIGHKWDEAIDKIREEA